MFYSTIYKSPIGMITLASNGNALVGLWFVGQKYYGAGIIDDTTPNDNLPIFDRTKQWLDEYFAGRKPDAASLPLAPIGGAFRQCVWNALRHIPYGAVVTYGDIARDISRIMGRPTSPRAVGGAVGHNPISIIIPCHRVVGASGKLTGYAGGIETKKKLLRHEKAIS